MCAQLLKSCLTLCDPVDHSPLGSSVHGLLQARILEWAAISFSRGIFLTQGSNLHFLYWQTDSLLLSHQGSPRHGEFKHPVQCYSRKLWKYLARIYISSLLAQRLFSVKSARIYISSLLARIYISSLPAQRLFSVKSALLFIQCQILVTFPNPNKLEDSLSLPLVFTITLLQTWVFLRVLLPSVHPM